MGFNIKNYFHHIPYHPIDSLLFYLPRHVETYSLNLDPDYQRGHVWTEEQAGRFVAHIITGGVTSRLLMNSPDGLYNFEILDGKQRLTALLRWLDNEIPAVFYDDTTAYRRDLDEESLQMIGSVRCFIPFGITRLSRTEVLDYYIRLNRGGTVHSDAEIQRVRELLEQEKAAKAA